MNALKRYAYLSVLALVLVGALAYTAGATDSDKRLFDSSRLQISTGTAYINSASADYTTWINLIEIAPENQHAMYDVKVVLFLDKATTGFADSTGYDTETISFAPARKVDGTNWATSQNLATTAIAADNADDRAVELDLGSVSPDEDLRIMVKLSAEVTGGSADVGIPYVIYYRAGARATVTPVAD